MLYILILIVLTLAALLAVLTLRQKSKIDTMKTALNEQSELLANLRETYRELEATKPLRELGQATSFINHEIKNHMMVISGYAMLLQRSKTLDDKNRAMVDNIAQGVASLQSFSQGVIEVARAKIAHENIEFDLVQNLKSCIEANFKAQEKDIYVGCTAPDGTILVNGSPGKLEKVFANALRNAFEAGAKQVSVRMLVHNYMALAVIEDDGPGCDAAYLPNLSETFFTTKRSGTGLGLCVMRSIVEAHGGNISIYTKNPLGNNAHGLSVQMIIPASKKMPYTAAKSEVLLVKEGLSDSAGIMEKLKNLKILPRTAEFAKDVESAPKNSSLGLMVLAAAEKAAELKSRPESSEAARILSLEKIGDGQMLVRNTDDNRADLFTEEYIITHLCN